MSEATAKDCLLIRLLRWLESKPKHRRIDYRVVMYSEAEELLARGWTIAPEEDRNRRVGVVCLELLETR